MDFVPHESLQRLMENVPQLEVSKVTLIKNNAIDTRDSLVTMSENYLIYFRPTYTILGIEATLIMCNHTGEVLFEVQSPEFHGLNDPRMFHISGHMLLTRTGWYIGSPVYLKGPHGPQAFYGTRGLCTSHLSQSFENAHHSAMWINLERGTYRKVDIDGKKEENDVLGIHSTRDTYVTVFKNKIESYSDLHNQRLKTWFFEKEKDRIVQFFSGKTRILIKHRDSMSVFDCISGHTMDISHRHQVSSYAKRDDTLFLASFKQGKIYVMDLHQPEEYIAPIRLKSVEKFVVISDYLIIARQSVISVHRMDGSLIGEAKIPAEVKNSFDNSISVEDNNNRCIYTFRPLIYNFSPYTMRFHDVQYKFW